MTVVQILASMFMALGVGVVWAFGIGVKNTVQQSELKPKKIKVLIIDTGIEPHVKLTKHLPAMHNTEDYKVSHPHGTHIAGIVLYGNMENEDPVCDNVEIHSCKFYVTTDKSKLNKNVNKTIDCLKKALSGGYYLVNYSAGGRGFDQGEHDALKAVVDAGIKVVVAAGNGGKHIKQDDFYPAGYDLDISVVGSIDKDGERAITSNYAGGIVYDYGVDIMSTAPGNSYSYESGTSQAAAFYSHKLLKRKCSQSESKNRKPL